MMLCFRPSTIKHTRHSDTYRVSVIFSSVAILFALLFELAQINLKVLFIVLSCSDAGGFPWNYQTVVEQLLDIDTVNA